jgi:hypothetical protein
MIQRLDTYKAVLLNLVISSLNLGYTLTNVAQTLTRDSTTSGRMLSHTVGSYTVMRQLMR